MLYVRSLAYRIRPLASSAVVRKKTTLVGQMGRGQTLRAGAREAD